MASRDPKMDPNPNTHKENDPNSLSSPPPKASQSDPKSLTSTLSPRTNSGFPSFSQLLQGVMSANSGCPNLVQPVSPGPFVQNAGFEGAFSISHQEVLASVTARAAQAQAQSQPRATTVNSSTEKLTVAPSESTALKDALKVQTENRKVGSNDTPALLNSPPKALTLDVRSSSSIKIRSEEKHNSEMHDNDIIEPNDDIQKTPKSDEYSWRKYGQKQVKSSESSRSYYRCTQAGCHAKKKVQHLDESGVVIAVVYKGDHNHDPPQKTRLTSHRKRAKAEMIGNTDDSDAPKSRIETKRLLETRENEPRNSNSLVAATHTNAEKQHKRTPDRTPSAENRKVISFPDEKKRVSNVPNKVPTADVINENDGAPRKKRMIKEGGKAYPDASYKTVKDPKIIVHANGDGEIVSDGYKWRKYGQKMVKGNPYPRSYYRCTSAGCPVRKHVEKATNDSTAIIVTYEGKHDHDLPVPKKRHSSPNAAPLVSPTATTAKLNDTKSPSQEPSTDLSVEEKGNTDKVVESARTLLSIGIELKSC